jgi:hypothetical protein
MIEISLEQLEEMQKDLFKKQCDLDIQKAFVKHFIKKKQSKQLTLTDVSQQREQLSTRPNTSSTWECFSRADKQKKGNV